MSTRSDAVALTTWHCVCFGVCSLAVIMLSVLRHVSGWYLSGMQVITAARFLVYSPDWQDVLVTTWPCDKLLMSNMWTVPQNSPVLCNFSISVPLFQQFVMAYHVKCNRQVQGRWEHLPVHFNISNLSLTIAVVLSQYRHTCLRHAKRWHNFTLI